MSEDHNDELMALTIEKYYVSKSMIEFGGHFNKCIGEAISCAHIHMIKHLKECFYYEWIEYLELWESQHGFEREDDYSILGMKKTYRSGHE